MGAFFASSTCFADAGDEWKVVLATRFHAEHAKLLAQTEGVGVLHSTHGLHVSIHLIHTASQTPTDVRA